MELTIHAIRKATEKNSPYFFSDKTLSYFGQDMFSFEIRKAPSGKVFIYAPSYWKDFESGKRKLMGFTLREFTGDDLKQPEGISGTDFKTNKQVETWIDGQ